MKNMLMATLLGLIVSGPSIGAELCRLADDGATVSHTSRSDNRARLEDMTLTNARFVGSVGTVSVIVDNTFNDSEASKVLRSVQRLHDAVYRSGDEIYRCAANRTWKGGDIHGAGIKILVWDYLFKYRARRPNPRAGSSVVYGGHNLYIRDYRDEIGNDPTRGLAFVGPVGTGDYWKHNRSLLLNRGWINWYTESQWAGIIAHEIMHTFSYEHDSAGTGFFIYSYGDCVSEIS